MAPRTRREIPDNLDPLVDTLANVVGILVIVIVLTQIELGDALARVIELDLQGKQAEREHADTLPEIEATLMGREEALFRRTDVEAEEAIELAREYLESLALLPAASASKTGGEIEHVASLRAELRKTRAAAEERERYAEAIRIVPARMVARLPDPELVRGNEAWILVRYGRVYLVDRKHLFEEGIAGIRRILRDGENRSIRPDEFEAIALYLRKLPIGDGTFRWHLQADPRPRVELAWLTRDGGLDHTRLDQDPRWRAWLAGLNPESDFVRFQVWNDSFETYLAARQSVEAAGLRAGWKGYAEDEELVRLLRFTTDPIPEQPIEVD